MPDINQVLQQGKEWILEGYAATSEAVKGSGIGPYLWIPFNLLLGSVLARFGRRGHLFRKIVISSLIVIFFLGFVKTWICMEIYQKGFFDLFGTNMSMALTRTAAVIAGMVLRGSGYHRKKKKREKKKERKREKSTDELILGKTWE